MRGPRGLLLVLLAALVLPLLLPGAGHAGKKERKAEAARIATLAAKYQEFLYTVEVLMTEEERASFLALDQDYQRDAFIEKFWRSRDPYPDTARNELQDKWNARLEEARALFGDLRDERSLMMLRNGFPDFRMVIRCSANLWPTEVWFYDKGSNRTKEELFLIFYQHWGAGPWRTWIPTEGVAALLQDFSVTTMRAANDAEAVKRIRDGCAAESGDALLTALSKINRNGPLAYPLQLMRAEAPLESPSGEWLATFASYSTDVPQGAQTFPAELGFSFPGKRQNRTIVQGTVKIATADLGQAEIGGARSYNLLITGEVLLDDKLFDRFRYKFDFPSSEVTSEHLPLVFQRPLRPGTYRTMIKVEDLNGHRYFRVAPELVVPAVEGAPPPPIDIESAQIMAEANAVLAMGETTVKLLRPVGQDMLAGKTRFDALVTGDRVASVTFSLDNQPILSKRNPPWSVELDLGHLPRSQVLRATATDPEGNQLASDELLVNASAHRFAVRISSPLRGQHFERSVRVVAETEVPEGAHIERVELFRDETLVATLYQPPYEQPISLTEAGALTYLRAIAYLPDGSSTEDHVFINAPPGMEEVDVQLVELYTAVTDRAGRPVDGLTQDAFTVLEDGSPQELVRFEQVRDLPIKAGVLLDISASMVDSLADAQQAALSFFTDTITPKDRAALITFNDRPQLVVKLTNNLLELGGGLAGLKAERGTSLYDSVVFALYYFNGLRGQRALIVLSDGKDEGSKFNFPDTLEFARRAGVTIYTIGLDLQGSDHDAKKALEKLAEETGGRSFFVEQASELAPVYKAIQEELRSQYLLVYQSSNAKPSKQFREVQVKVRESGLKAQTIRGYYP